MRITVFLRQFVILAAALLLISSCATLSPNGVGRVKRYTFAEESVPEELDGWKFAFVSDLHYPSLFTPKRLGKLVRKRMWQRYIMPTSKCFSVGCFS